MMIMMRINQCSWRWRTGRTEAVDVWREIEPKMSLVWEQHAGRLVACLLACLLVDCRASLLFLFFFLSFWGLWLRVQAWGLVEFPTCSDAARSVSVGWGNRGSRKGKAAANSGTRCLDVGVGGPAQRKAKHTFRQKRLSSPMGGCVQVDAGFPVRDDERWEEKKTTDTM